MSFMTSNARSPLHRSTFGFLSVTAAAALALSACAPEEDLPAEEDTNQTEESPAAEAEETDTAEDTEQDTQETDDAAADDEAAAEDTETEDDAEDATEDDAAEASGDHPVYQAIETVLAEYSDGVITEFEDNTDEDGYVEVFVYDGTTEWEHEVDSETFEIIDTEDDGIDADDEEEAQAVEIDISEALQTAETESGGAPEDGELDTEDGTVVWEFEMDNDVEVYVDVATGEVVRVDN